MLFGKLPLTIYRMPALIGVGALLCCPARGNPTNPSPAPPPPAAPVIDPPLVAYPPITPLTAARARSISELRHLKTATGSPRLPTPNAWFTTDLYQGTLTRQQFEQKLHSLYDPFSAFLPYLDIDDSRVVVYPSAKERLYPQFVLRFAPPNRDRKSTRL